MRHPAFSREERAMGSALPVASVMVRHWINDGKRCFGETGGPDWGGTGGGWGAIGRAGGRRCARFKGPFVGKGTAVAVGEPRGLEGIDEPRVGVAGLVLGRKGTRALARRPWSVGKRTGLR